MALEGRKRQFARGWTMAAVESASVIESRGEPTAACIAMTVGRCVARGREGVGHRSLASDAGVRSAAECELGYAIGVSRRTGCGVV